MKCFSYKPLTQLAPGFGRLLSLDTQIWALGGFLATVYGLGSWSSWPAFRVHSPDSLSFLNHMARINFLEDQTPPKGEIQKAGRIIFRVTTLYTDPKSWH